MLRVATVFVFFEGGFYGSKEEGESQEEDQEGRQEKDQEEGRQKSQKENRLNNSLQREVNRMFFTKPVVNERVSSVSELIKMCKTLSGSVPKTSL